MRVAYSECSRELRQIDINPAEKSIFVPIRVDEGKPEPR